MPISRTSTWLDDQRKDYINPKRPKQRNCSKQLQTDNLPLNDVENTNSTNKGKDLLLANKPRIVPWRTERMPQRIQRHSRITLHRSIHPKWKQDKTEKSSYGLDWLQKGIWYGSTKLDTTLSQNVQNITWSHKLHWKDHANLESGADSRRKKLSRSKDPKRNFPSDALSPLLFIIAMMPFNLILRKCIAGYKLSWSQEKINHLMYMDDIKPFAKNEKELETLIHAVRIYSQDIRMEFGIEKCAMLVKKSGKRHMTDGMKLPNHDKVRTLRENETYKYLGILEADTIKQMQMKDKSRKEYLRRTRKLLGTKLSSRNLIKGINTWAVPLVRYSGPFLKWTRDELQQTDQRTRKLMTCIGHYIPETTLSDYMYLGRKRTCQHRRQRWRIDTTARRLHWKTRTRTDYSHQKRYGQHDRR